MRKNKILRYSLIILIFFLICIFSYCIISSATTINPEDYRPSSSTVGTKLKTKANLILGVIQAVGSVVSVIALVVIGIKYVVGSAQEKAEYKKTMVPYLIGAILVFATSNLVQIIYNLGVEINK